MDIRLAFSVFAGKALIKVCRLLRHSGTTLPGKIAARIDHNILLKLSKSFFTIIVTGTNGKTTTTSMIAQILYQNGVDCITNKSGANLFGGIATLFVDSVKIFGKSKNKYAVIEVDEATINRITDYIEPDIIVVTNFFRDQLDRYGELYTTLQKVKSGILKSKKTRLILNADDSLCTSLASSKDNENYFYGVEDNVVSCEDEDHTIDAAYCIHCKTKYVYSYRVLGHLGGFRCPVCGYERPVPDVRCLAINKLTNSNTSLDFMVNKKIERLEIPAPGFFNVYNALAAVTFGYVMNYPVNSIIGAFENFHPSFGRMENIHVADKNIKLILAKNPTGFNQIINYLMNAEENLNVAFLINDRTQDGTDISWLWDVSFEKLLKRENSITQVYASGTRAYDMAVRLKYAGISPEKIKITEDYDELIREGLNHLTTDSTLYIVPTYTAMLDIRNKLRKKYKLKDFWI